MASESKESEMATSLTCDKGHQLKRLTHDMLRKEGYSERGYWCDICGKGKGKADAWHCSTCGYDLCDDCEKNKLRNDVVCDKNHKLDYMSNKELVAQGGDGYKNGYICDVCCESKGKSAVFHCNQGCGYDLCHNCSKLNKNEKELKSKQGETSQKIFDYLCHDKLDLLYPLLEEINQGKIHDGVITMDWALNEAMHKQCTMLIIAVSSEVKPFFPKLMAYKVL